MDMSIDELVKVKKHHEEHARWLKLILRAVDEGEELEDLLNKPIEDLAHYDDSPNSLSDTNSLKNKVAIEEKEVPTSYRKEKDSDIAARFHKQSDTKVSPDTSGLSDVGITVDAVYNLEEQLKQAHEQLAMVSLENKELKKNINALYKDNQTLPEWLVDGGYFYCINISFRPNKKVWKGTDKDMELLENGNVFETESDAFLMSKRMSVFMRLWFYADGGGHMLDLKQRSPTFFHHDSVDKVNPSFSTELLALTALNRVSGILDILEDS